MATLEKIVPTAGQKRILMMHLIGFIIVNAILWILCYSGSHKGFVYPWPIWITSAWALAFIGHWAALYTRYTDRGMEKYQYDAKN
jgi:hypothetical protein